MSGRDHRTNRNHYKRVDFAGKVTIKPEQLREVMNDLLAEYGAEVIDVAVTAADEVSKETKDELRTGVGGYQDRTGIYRNSWRARLETKNIEVKAITYNDSAWQLTHLLEFGHVNRDGTRSRKFPHLAQLNEWAVSEFERRIRQGVESL